MMKMRIILFLGMLALVCLSVGAEDPKAEPESAAEPSAEPESTHDDTKHAGSSTSENKAKNPAAALSSAFSIPAILALSAVAKFVL